MNGPIQRMGSAVGGARREREIVTANQKAVFKALAALGIERVLISFDACADAGQIDGIAITGGAGKFSGDVASSIATWKRFTARC